MIFIFSNQKMFSIELTDRTSHSVALKWSCDSDDYDVFKLEMRYGQNPWFTMYWGTDNQTSVRHLEANLCFTFRAVALKLVDDFYESLDVSASISVCTLPETLLTSFHRTVQKRQTHSFKLYVQNFPDFINMPGRGGVTAIGFGVIHDNDDCVRFLLENGAQVNLGIPELGRTPFMLAIARANIKLARAVMEKRPNVNLQDLNKMSAGHFAVDTDQLEMVRFCVEHGANLELRDNCHYTLLLRAVAMMCKMDVIEYLIEKGAEIAVVDKFKLGCLDHAKLQGRYELIEELQKYTFIKLSREATP